MNDPLDFTGKVVLVTGSSRGIGAAMIKAFDDRGAQCVVNFISDPEGTNKRDATNVAGELKNPLVVDCDVTKPERVEAMMKSIADQFGGLDVLVNNSGIIRDRTIKKLTLDEFESVVRVNLAGTFNVTQKAAAVLRQRRAHHQFLLGQRPDGAFRPGELFVEQSGDHCPDESLGARVRPAADHGQRDRARIHRCRDEQRDAG